MNKENNSRRDFLLTGLLAAGAGLGAVAGCHSKKDPFEAAADGTVKPSGKKVKLLSVDGEVIEVDEAFLKPVPHLPAITNSEARIGIPGKKFVSKEGRAMKLREERDLEFTLNALGTLASISPTLG